MTKIVFTFIVVLIGASIAVAQDIQLSIPVVGELGRDVLLVNHVDHDNSAEAIREFQCGVLTYDGHDGTDFVIKSFAVMDSGVVVVAAAPGEVIAVVDSLFDRNKISVVERGFGNYISIRHDNGYVTNYAHIRTGSAMVTVGDKVEREQPLALIGSSGNSSDPHLHFELWKRIDPFAGACSQAESYWRTQPEPTSDFLVVDYGVTDWPATLDTIRERPPAADVIDTAASTVTFWSLLSGVQETDEIRLTWFTPAGVEWFSFATTPGVRSNYYYWFSFIDRPTTPGEWTCQLLRNDVVVARDTFRIESVTSVRDPRGSTSASLMSHIITSEVYDVHGAVVAYGNNKRLQEIVKALPNGTFLTDDGKGKLVFVVSDGVVVGAAGNLKRDTKPGDD